MILDIKDPDNIKKLESIRWLRESDDHLVSYLLSVVEKKKAESN